MYLVVPRPVHLLLAGTIDEQFLKSRKLIPPTSIHPPSYSPLSCAASCFSDGGTEMSASPGPLESSYISHRARQMPIGTPRQHHVHGPYTSTPAARGREQLPNIVPCPHEPTRSTLASSMLQRLSLREQPPPAEFTQAESQVRRPINGGKPSGNQHTGPTQRPSLSSHESAPIPLWEEPILFPGLRAFERYYTRELCDEDDEILIPRQPSTNTVWSHSPRTQRTHGPCKELHAPPSESTTTTVCPGHYNFKRHPIPLGGPNPFRPSPLRNTSESFSRRLSNSVRPKPTGPPPALVNPSVIRAIEQLLEEDDEEIIVYDPNPLVAEDDDNQRKQPRKKHHQAIVNQRAYDRFAHERRNHSPPETTRRLPGGSVSQHDQGQGYTDDFHDFPVCEMSIAMGLHEPFHRADM